MCLITACGKIEIRKLATAVGMMDVYLCYAFKYVVFKQNSSNYKLKSD